MTIHLEHRMIDHLELSPKALRRTCTLCDLPFDDTTQIQPLDEVIGQKRAVQALDFGLNMMSAGYNIFVTGIDGTGKSSIVRDIVERHAASLPVPDDWCLVNNFKDESSPKVLGLPPGQAPAFAKAMSKLMDDIRIELPKVLESAAFQEQYRRIQREYGEKQRKLFEELEGVARAKHLRIASDDDGYHAVPVENDTELTAEAFQKLPPEKQSEIERNLMDVQQHLETTLREIQKINDVINEHVEEITREMAQMVITERMRGLRERHADHEGVRGYLDEVQEDILDHIDRFVSPEEHPEEPEEEDTLEDGIETFLRRYKVNVLVDHSEQKGAPVIFETNPTYPNVIGRIEKRSQMGILTTDFLMVQAGSMLKANGGFLIMEIDPLMQNPFIWDALKRSLQNRSLVIEEMSTDLGYATATLRPQEIPLNIKVILLGEYELFEWLQNEDSKFNRIFRVRADFDYEVSCSRETEERYARFVALVCRREGLLPFTRDAVAAVVEYGHRLVEDQQKLSLRFGPIVGLLKEAEYLARKAGKSVVDASFIEWATDAYRFRYNLYEEKIHESYVDGTILIDVTSHVIGQVNGLTVYQIGEISFGRPCRITAESFVGKSGIVNIEREVELSGSSHDKGVMILSGYLGRTFAKKYPIGVSISITFEQNYGEIDGDSASLAELLAVISTIGDVPIDQGIAVTGSVNQKGEVQAIGGINEKIEGFYDVCLAKGLTGRQGVILPKANVRHLMLRKDVVAAAEQKAFHLYAVSDVREAVEILTGIPAGDADLNGNFPKETVFGKVQEALFRSWTHQREWLRQGTGGYAPILDSQ